MCGIFGVFEGDGGQPTDQRRLRETLHLLAHRGPDDQGSLVEPGLVLGHTRLSLLDLSPRGAQPMTDQSGRWSIVYNGEVYDYRELRTELEAEGVVFRTGTDTEVVLEAIARRGVRAVLPRLGGMFALGVWDRHERRLTLARDRFGMKPLLVFRDGRRLWFASEAKALMPWHRLRPDGVAVSAYLLGFGGPTREQSMFEGVRMLTPGTVLEVDEAGERSWPFFELHEFWDPELQRELAAMPPAALVDRLEARLLASVERHLFADAPVGAFCSGGVDSSLVMAMAARRHGQLAVFHADVRGPSSERAAAEKLARHLGLDMHVVEVDDRDFVDWMARVTWHYEYPYAYHPNSVPFARVAWLVRERGVKAVLSGEGADECFLGYSFLVLEPLRRRLAAAGTRCRRLLRRVPILGTLIAEPAADLDLVRDLHQRFELRLERDDLKGCLDGGRAQRARTDARELRTLELLTYHLRTLLHRNDVLGMSASIEARFPFLDHDVVRDAVNLPYRCKIRPAASLHDRSHPGFVDKWILRRVAERYLPRELSHRKKLGFPTTAHQRLRVDRAWLARSWVRDAFTLTERQADYLSREGSGELCTRLVLLETWARVFLLGERHEDVQADLRRHVEVLAAAPA